MCARIEGGSGVERLLAGATVLRAVAEAGLGNEAAAHWDFATAQTLVTAAVLEEFAAEGRSTWPAAAAARGPSTSG